MRHLKPIFSIHFVVSVQWFAQNNEEMDCYWSWISQNVSLKHLLYISVFRFSCETGELNSFTYKLIKRILNYALVFIQLNETFEAYFDHGNISEALKFYQILAQANVWTKKKQQIGKLELSMPKQRFTQNN